MIKTVIFDFDGTIADTFITIVKLFNNRAKEFGIEKLDLSEVENLRNLGIKAIFKKFGIHILKLPRISKIIRNDLKAKTSSINIFPQLKYILLKLKQKKFKLGILSSNSKENIEKFLKVNRLNIFDFIQSEKNLFGKGKALTALLKKYNLKENEVIYIGDEVRDIDACRENGIKIISVTWGFNKNEILQLNRPDYLVNRPQEILKIVSV